jgi:ABC-type branched-subunit amino acid transport system substrate-binding protein
MSFGLDPNQPRSSTHATRLDSFGPISSGTEANMTQRRPRSTLIVLALILALGAAGASGTSAATAAKPTGAPLKLMAVYESTGPSASPEISEGAIAAAKAINAKGGIKGRPVQIIRCDTKADPNVATGCGRTAVSQGVVAMVGNLTIFSNRFMPLLARHKIPSIGLEPATGTDFTSPASFPIGGGAPVQFAGLGAALAEAGAKKIVLARQDIPEAAAVAPFVNAGLKRFHLKMRDLAVPVGAPDMAPYAAAALSGGTDGIVVTQADQDAVNFVLAVRQADPKVKIALNATSLTAVNKALGRNADGIIENGATTTALKNTAERQYEKDAKAAGYTNLTAYSLASYASVRLVQRIANGLPKTTAPAVFNVLRRSTNLETGFTPPLQFTKGGVAGLPRVFNACLFAFRIKGGKQVPITGKFENAFTGKQCPTPR